MPSLRIMGVRRYNTMRTSTTLIKISPALLEAQREIGAATKTSVNPFFHSTYASLGDVMEACKGALNKNGITVLQPIDTSSDGMVVVETTLLHESGEWIMASMRIAPKSETNPQDQGSAISYARRYSLQSMVFIPAEDDDAEKATNRKGGTDTKELAKVINEKAEVLEAQKDCTCGTTNMYHRKDCPAFERGGE